MKQIYKNNLSVAYQITGSGPVVILIHGFMETHEIWSGFSDELSKHFKVISIDLPGHGKSDLFDKPYKLENYAESLLQIIEEEKILKFFIIGHSMGGYIALAFAEQYPEYLNGLCLFHSTPFSDNPEKMTARINTIESIREGKLNEIIKQHFNNVFAEKNVPKYKAEINNAANIARRLKEKSVIASILAMADRKDRNMILLNAQFPILLIVGKEDKLIPASILTQIDLNETSKIQLLEHSGHMGMIEEKDYSLKIVKEFIDNC